MAATTEWPIERANVAELRLDPANVRIQDSTPNEQAILNYLYVEEDALELARQILVDGYIDNDIPIVVEERKVLVVIEGNRRLAALKGLLDPAAVTARTVRLEQLLERHNGDRVPDQIRVMRAPSRAAAQATLARLHTKNPKKSWPPEQQARFFHAQLEGGVTVAQLKDDFPSVTNKIVRFIKMGEMTQLIRSVKFKDSELNAFVEGNKLKATSFEYAYLRDRLLSAFGLSFGADGRLRSRRVNASGRRALEQVLLDFMDDRLDTRAPQLRKSKPEHDAYAAWVESVASGESEISREPFEDRNASKPSAGSAGNPDSTPTSPAGGVGGPASTGTSEGATDNRPGTAKKAGRRKNESRYVSLGSLNMPTDSPALRNRYEELARLDVNEFPHAALLLVRTILECTIKRRFKLDGSPLPPGTHLRQALKATEDKFRAANNKGMLSIINSLSFASQANSAKYHESATMLDQVAHEPNLDAEPGAVHRVWDKIYPLLIELL